MTNHKKKLKGKELQEYLQTHTPSRSQRRKLEKLYRKQQRDIKSGRRVVQKKSPLEHVYSDPALNEAWNKLPMWKRAYKFIKFLFFWREK